MGPHQITRRNRATPEEEAAMQAFMEQSRRDADRVNAAFMLAKQQQDAADFQDKLLAATNQTRETMIGIREWLRHNQD